MDVTLTLLALVWMAIGGINYEKMDKKYYYKVHLEVVLKRADFIFGFINISHIPYSKLEELFFDQVVTEKFLFDEGMSYFIEEDLYMKNKVFFDKEIPFTFDFNLFDYSVSLTGDDLSKLKRNYYEELPDYFEDR